MTINIFKKIILLQVFIFLSIFLLVIVEDTFFAYEEVEYNDTTIEVVIYLVYILLLPFMWYCLYKLKRIGKKLFIFYLIFSFISHFLFSLESYNVTTVTSITPLFEFSENAYGLLDGVILAFLFFTDVKEKFE